jgi:hypothetical protein
MFHIFSACTLAKGLKKKPQLRVCCSRAQRLGKGADLELFEVSNGQDKSDGHRKPFHLQIPTSFSARLSALC